MLYIIAPGTGLLMNGVWLLCHAGVLAGELFMQVLGSECGVFTLFCAVYDVHDKSSPVQELAYPLYIIASFVLTMVYLSYMRRWYLQSQL